MKPHINLAGAVAILLAVLVLLGWTHIPAHDLLAGGVIAAVLA